MSGMARLYVHSVVHPHSVVLSGRCTGSTNMRKATSQLLLDIVVCDRDVVVYRLITCGSVEEKIYRRQVFKASCIWLHGI